MDGPLRRLFPLLICGPVVAVVAILTITFTVEILLVVIALIVLLVVRLVALIGAGFPVLVGRRLVSIVVITIAIAIVGRASVGLPMLGKDGLVFVRAEGFGFLALDRFRRDFDGRRGKFHLGGSGRCDGFAQIGRGGGAGCRGFAPGRATAFSPTAASARTTRPGGRTCG